MESANTHHHHPQLQDQLAGSSASCYGLPFTTTHVWPPPSLFETVHPESTAVSSHLNSSMAQEITTYNWANNATTNSATNHHSDQDLQHHSRIKEELARYIEMLSSSPQSSTDQHANDATTKFLLNLMNNNTANARGFAQIFPASLNQMPVTNPVSLEMNLEAFDLLASTRFCGNQIGTMRDGFFNYGFDHMQQQSLQIPFYDSTKVSSPPSNAVVEAKRNSNKMEAKSHLQNAPKRFRLEARSSCPPLKVRKEKLGDRIAALQQLVAPYGKTDTASVLMEAIGYIKFLQNQVETLSVPYMKASLNKLNRVAKGNHNENETEESERDLKSPRIVFSPIVMLVLHSRRWWRSRLATASLWWRHLVKECLERSLQFV